MGAITFATRATGETVQEAFEAATKEARFLYGHGGYTGTIAEKGSYTLIPKSEVGDADPEEYANQLLYDGDERVNDKWGPAGVIQVGENRYLFFGWASS